MKRASTLNQNNIKPLKIIGEILSDQGSLNDIPSEAWTQIVDTALNHGLAPMLGWRIGEEHQATIPGDQLERLKQSGRETTIRYMLFNHEQRRVQAALESQAIPLVWLKGLALAETVYPEPALRPMEDMDLLVHYTDRHRAKEIVESLSYHPPSESDSLLIDSATTPEAFIYHYHLRGGVGDRVTLELHFRLFRDHLVDPGEAIGWFWQQTIEVEGDLNCFAFNAEAQILTLSAHSFLHHQKSEVLLKQIFDIHLIIKTYDIDWVIVADKAKELRWGSAVKQALNLCEVYFGTVIPEEIARLTEEDTVSTSRFEGTDGRWEYLAHHLSPLSWGERFTVARQVVFPSPAYMRSRYTVPAARWVLPYYLVRWWDQAGVILAAVIRRMRKVR